MSFEKMVETYSRTSRTQNSDPSLFLFSKPNSVLEFCIDKINTTTTHIKIQTHFIYFFFFLRLNFHSFIQNKRKKTIQSSKKIKEVTGESTKPTLSIKIQCQNSNQNTHTHTYKNPPRFIVSLSIIPKCV